MRRFSTRSWRAVKRFSARIPLRIKLITAALALVAIALAVISAVSIVVFRGYLLDQVDQQLTDRASRPNGFGTSFGSGPFVPGQVVMTLLDSNGQVLYSNAPPLPGVPGQPGEPGPDILSSAAWIRAHAGSLTTVPATSGGGSWRVIIKPVHYKFRRIPFVVGPDNLRIVVTNTSQAGQAGTFVAAWDLGSINHTIGTLTLIDLAVSGVVILILAGVGIALIRTSLRPLAEIEQTAGAIAAGDLSQRVPDRDPRTEVGSLGRSLNLMLGQIEHAFRAQSASEATARQSEERMRRFVADASHELRTPLSVIRGFAEYYRQRGGLREDELDRMIRRVEDEAARMGMLVEDLLLLARLDQQRPLQRKPVDLLALAADAAQDARMLAPRRDIQLSVGSGGPFLVLGDDARLRQIIRNLVNNALTHTPEGAPVELRLRTSTTERQAPHGHQALAGHEAPEGYEGSNGHEAPDRPEARDRHEGPAWPESAAATAAVVLEVADSGPGLTPEQAERVFERFYRADAARTRKTGGTGLGLAIVAALTAAHGGTASLETRPGQGATFRVTLPLAPEAAEVQQSSSRAPESPDTLRA